MTPEESLAACRAAVERSEEILERVVTEAKGVKLIEGIDPPEDADPEQWDWVLKDRAEYRAIRIVLDGIEATLNDHRPGRPLSPTRKWCAASSHSGWPCESYRWATESLTGLTEWLTISLKRPEVQ